MDHIKNQNDIQTPCTIKRFTDSVFTQLVHFFYIIFVLLRCYDVSNQYLYFQIVKIILGGTGINILNHQIFFKINL